MQRILYFGTYDRGEGRNAILIEGLRRAGADVVECHVPLWESTAAKLRAARGGRADLALATRQAAAWASLTRFHARVAAYEVMVVGSTGHLDVPLARRLSRSRGRPLVFDPLVSIAETVRDRSLVPAGSLRLRWIRRAERRIFGAADLVVADTGIHAEAFAAATGLDPSRLAVVPAGAPPAFRKAATPYEPRRDDLVRVGYFGQYIPLHGLDTVLGAADRLRDHARIRFDLVGRGQLLGSVRADADRRRLPNVRFHDTWLSPARLARDHMRRTDLVLGVFGEQPKARRIVPFKVYAGLASARPVVTSRSPAVRELLAADDEVATVPSGDAAALADAIADLAANPERRARLARAGQQAYDARFSADILGRRLSRLLEGLASRSQASLR